jgi:hypothetical protein
MSDGLAVGQVRKIPFRLSTSTLTVSCLVMDQRVVFGRTEWQITPVDGEGTAWVQEANLLDDSGPRVVNEKFQGRHDKIGGTD